MANKKPHPLLPSLSAFKSWCDRQGKYSGYADSLNVWCSRSSLRAQMINDLLNIYSWNVQKGEDIMKALVGIARQTKYKAYSSASKSYGSKKSKLSASKKANTADNVISHLNKYFEYIKQSHTLIASLSPSQRTVVEEFISKYLPVKNQHEFSNKLRSSLETQDRFFQNGKTVKGYIASFPITLIRKILGGRNGIKAWEQNIIDKTEIHTSFNGLYHIDDIVSVRIEPWNVILRLKTKKGKTVERKLQSRKDVSSPFKPFRAFEFRHITIGHMPPISQVYIDLMKNGLSLPAIAELSDLIGQYFTSNKIAIDAKNLKKEADAIVKLYASNWTVKFKQQLLDDLYLIDKNQSYELQQGDQNSSMGGVKISFTLK